MAFNLIKFKKGTLAGLNTKVSQSAIEEGSFYLTIDENKETSRLYIGTATNKVLPVNSNITVVTNTSELNASHAGNFNDGDFAYVTNGNILAVRYNGSWTQINAPDSRAIKDLTPSVTVSNGVATVEWFLRDQNDNEIKEAGTTTIPNITMQGASGITVSGSGKAITITGDPATLGSSAPSNNSATISLTSTGNTASGSVGITGTNGVYITGNSTNAMTIKGTVNSSMTAEADTTSGIVVTVIDSEEDSVHATIDPKITLGTHTNAADEISFTPVNHNGDIHAVANLPVYTKDEIDSRLTAIDAMTYKGTISGSTITNQTSGVYIGDTFKASTGFTLPAANSSTNGAISVKAGDLLIVSNSNTGTEPFTGGSIKYDVIPSGDDTYTFKGLGASHDGNGIQVEDGSTGDVVSSIEVTNGNQIAVSSTHSGTNGSQTTIQVSHATISSSTTGGANTPAAQATAANSQATHSEKTFNVVTGLTTNNGHVTATTITPIKVVDTVSQIDTTNTEVAVATASNRSTVTSTIALKDEGDTAINSTDLAFSIGSQNLTVTSSGTAITMNYVWETF